MAKLDELRERHALGEVWSYAVAIAFFFEDRGRSCLSREQIADGLKCSLSTVKTALRKLHRAGRLVTLEDADDELASYRLRANAGRRLWRVWVPRERVIHNEVTGGGQQQDLLDPSGQVIPSSSSAQPDLSKKQHRRSTGDGDPCTCARCEAFLAIASRPAPTPPGASDPKPLLPRVSPGPVPRPTPAPAPAPGVATRAEGADPVVIPPPLLDALARQHGPAAVRGILRMLDRPECREDPWCTLAAARVLASRPAHNPVGAFLGLVRRALAGEEMIDLARVAAEEQATLDAIAQNPDLAGEGVGVVWGELGIEENVDETSPRGFESLADWHARLAREREEAEAERNAQAARAAIEAHYSDELCDRLDRDEPLCHGSAPPDDGEGEQNAGTRARRQRRGPDLRAGQRGVPFTFVPPKKPRLDRATRAGRGLPHSRAGPVP